MTVQKIAGRAPRLPRWPICLLCGWLWVTSMGCSRLDYRFWADRQVYGIERERNTNPRWAAPFRRVEADPRSRLSDPGDPDFNPIPMDDPEARKWQVSGAYPFEFHGWKKRGSNPIEDLSWKQKLRLEPDGSVLISRSSSMEHAVMTSRDYQFQVENVYLTALSLTLARWQYAVQFFGNQRTFFQHFGTRGNDSNQLLLNTDEGFSQTFASGAQLLVDYSNALVFEFSGKGFNTASSGLLVNLTQPLLRGAFARIQTQPLSQEERQALYTIRDFAHFRRVFYVNIVGSSGYLGLLTQLQGIRNQESNLESQRRNLELYDELVAAGLATAFERDQFAQNVQQSEIGLISSRANLQTSLDGFKIQLGFPPDLLIKLDDSPLKEFELNDPKLDQLRENNDRLYLTLLQEAQPGRDKLANALKEVDAEFDALEGVLDEAFEEVGRWRSRLSNEDGKLVLDPSAVDRQVALSTKLKKTLSESRVEIAKNRATVRDTRAKLDSLTPDDAAKITLDLVGRDFRTRFTEVFFTQTQTRVFLIELTPVNLELNDAISIALANRLDLMNDQARVTDSWRNVEVAANQLRGGLNLVYSTNLSTDPKHDGIFRFDASNSTHRVGVQFDAPLNRLAERNVYRADQIAYQRSRRQYMATHDLILQQIRLDLRELNANRKNFDIAREQLITVSRQVDEAEYNVRTTRDASANVTVILSNALSNLLTAKNSLISTWVTYETTRLSLFRDFDLMDIDGKGVWTNERDDTSQYARCPPPGGFGAQVDVLGTAASGASTNTAAPIPVAR